MKILLSAYACEPNRGSEPGVGWNVAREIAKYHQVWVLTSNTHRRGIETELARTPISNLNFVYLDPLGWVYDWSHEWKKAKRGIYLHYYLWQIWAYFIARSLHHEIGFELINHVTYIKYSSPSYLALLPLPFVWGPVGGGESAPKSFWKDFTLRHKCFENLRELARWLGEHDPFVRLTAQRSILALATTQETAARLQSLKTRQIKILGECGLSQAEIIFLGNHPSPNNSSIRFISIGRLLAWKGFHLGIQAFAVAKLKNSEYWIIGDGPERGRLQELAKKLNISSQVKFFGSLPRDEALSKLIESHALVHPSLHDSGGWVCLEAMAAGRPVICLDLGGPATQVTQETGFKISADHPQQAVDDIANAMTYLANDSEMWVRMGKAGKEHVNQVYNWDGKGKILCNLYKEILDREKQNNELHKYRE